VTDSIVRSVGVREIATGAVALTIHSEIRGGPRWTVGQGSTLYFDDTGVTAILAALAAMPAYRYTWRVIASTLESAGGPDDSPEMTQRLLEVITKAIDASIAEMG
jgi:hypothetical protein